MRLALIGRRLALEGMRVRYAFRHSQTGAAVGIDPRDLLQSPQWPAPDPDRYSPGQLRKEATRSLGQVLGYAGFCRRDAVQAVAAQWEDIVGRESPDIVIADFAPSAVLAARGRMATLVVGEGYIVPPGDATRFHPFHAWTDRDLFDEDALLANVNSVQRAHSRPLLKRFVEAMQGDRNLVCSWRLLDPLARHRTEAPIGFVAERIARPVAGERQGTFAYLHRESLANDAVISALPRLPPPVNLCSPSIDEATARSLTAGGVRIFREFVDLADAIPVYRMVLHQSGVGLASMALAAAIPQLALTRHIENVLTGHALQRSGVGAALFLDTATAQEILAAANRLTEDPAVGAAALGHAKAILEEHPQPALDIVMHTARGIM